jgi:prepilin-type N-terminal cleavage/methylation domain-containing protein
MGAAIYHRIDIRPMDHMPPRWPAPRRRERSGFTLVELLVVIAIIGILLALLLPAVNAAREAARRTECQNHLRNLGQALLLHESAKGHLPTGGWGFAWTGDADRGSGLAQPGGWPYGILPFIEQLPLSKVGAGLSSTTSPTKSQATVKLITTPLEIFHCPSRRPAQLFTNFNGQHNSDFAPKVAHIDYAGNGGDSFQVDATQTFQPSSFSQGDDPNFWKSLTVNTGVILQHSRFKMKQILDGASKTYLVGEKYLTTDHYYDGMDAGDNETAYSGLNWDSSRTSGYSGATFGNGGYRVPGRDTAGSAKFPNSTDIWNFGSAHPQTFVMVFCDASVHNISYLIEPETHRRLANRADRLTIDSSQYQ